MPNSAISDKAESWIAQASAAPAFAGLAPGDLARLLAPATPLQFPQARAVFTRGEPAGSVYLVLSGTVSISTLAASGKRITVEIFQRDDLLGEIAAIDGGLRTADATATEPSRLLGIPAATFRSVLAGSAPLANTLLRLATARLRHTYALLEDASLRTVELRLARQVLYLLKLGATGEARVRLRARMHQDELADLLGITTRSVINVLNKWRAEALVSFDGRTAQLTILDIGRFRELAQE